MALPEYTDLPNSGSCNFYAKLDEISGTRSDDSANSNDLTDNNTVTSAGGLSEANATSDYAALFTRTNSEYLSAADAAEFDIASNLTAGGWFYFTTLPSSGEKYPLISKWGSGTARSYYMDLENNGGTYRIRSFWSNSSDTIDFLYTDWAGAAAATWFNIMNLFDDTNSDLKHFVDGSQLGSTKTASISNLKNTGTAFQIGGSAHSSDYANMRAQCVGLWSINFSDSDFTDFYEEFTVAPSSGLLMRKPMRGVGRGILRP